MNTATQAGNFEIGKILRLPAFFVCKKRREKTLNIAKLADWALRLDHPPWTASKGRGKQRFRRILTPLDISCRCCPYRYNEYADYVAEKVMEEMRRAKEPPAFPA